MTVVENIHADHGATFREVAGRKVVDHYGRPERTHRAVRNGVGVVEMGYGVVEVSGDDRIDFVDNAVSNRVPDEDGRGCYALLLDPQGHIETEMYVHNAGERLLVLTPPERATPLAEDWAGKTFIQDVGISVSTPEFGVFGVHGPHATEKVASVLNAASTPEAHLSFVRGSMGDAGVTVIRGDGLTGEEGYEVVCTADAADEVLDTLLTRGMNAAPFGYHTWETLTLEAGTPLFAAELEGRIPNAVGIRNALDFEKGCYVGQEVVSRIENRGNPPQRLVGLRPETVPEAGTTVAVDGEDVGTITHGADCPSVEGPAALALVDFDVDATTLTVADAPATVEALPFVEGSDRSARLPTYPT